MSHHHKVCIDPLDVKEQGRIIKNKNKMGSVQARRIITYNDFYLQNIILITAYEYNFSHQNVGAVSNIHEIVKSVKP